jgi:hypothetical protein
LVTDGAEAQDAGIALGMPGSVSPALVDPEDRLA